MSISTNSPKTGHNGLVLQTISVASLIVGALLVAVSFPYLKNNGVAIQVNDEAPRPTTWLWLDAVMAGSGASVTFTGTLWNDSAGSHTFEVVSDGALEIRFNDQLAYQHPTRGQLATETFTADLPAGASTVSIQYQVANPFTPRYEVSLRENGQLIPAWRLYAQPPTADLVLAQRWAWAGAQAGLFLFGLGSLLACLIGGLGLGRSRREWGLVLGIVILAMGVRIWVVLERYNSAPAIYAMQPIYDNFVTFGRELLAGNYELAGSYAQQGTIIYTALSQAAVGPGLLSQYLLNAVLGGLACGLVLGATWSLFGRTAGYVAGLLMALYAPIVHFQTTLQIVVPTTLAAAAVVALGAWLIRKPGWGAAIAYGVAVGWGTLCRSTLMGSIVAAPIALWFSSGHLSTKRRLALTLIALVSFAAAVAPIAWANAQVGVYSISSSGFPIAFFRGNNRDTFGINEYMTDRERLARLRVGGEDSFNPETLKDIRNDFDHWVQLMIHKVGLFWTGYEYSDRMIDFYSTGLHYSFALRLLWLGGLFNLYVVSAFAIIGLILNLKSESRAGLTMLIVAIFTFMGLTLVFPVTGRVRTPIHPALFPLAALGVVTLGQSLRQFQNEWRRIAVALSCALLFVASIHWFETGLPRPTTVAPNALPATLVSTNVEFDSKIKLLGFDAYDSDYKPGGYLDLTLYWQALQPIDTDYTVLIHLLNPALERLEGIDRQLGAANMPVYPSSQWQVGEIVRQSYLVRLPRIESAMPLRIAVALEIASGQRLPIIGSSTEVLDGTAALITGASVLPEIIQAPALPRPLNLQAESELTLISTNLSETEEITTDLSVLDIALNWAAIQHPSSRYHLFLHLFDANGALVTQWDGSLVADFETDTWGPNQTWAGHYALTIPANIPTGTYQLAAGLYSIGDLHRLSLTGDATLLLPDNRFLLSTIVITQ